MTCKVRVFGHTGNLLGESEAASVGTAQAWADGEHPHGSAVVRGDTTSDGTVWAGYNGRVLASRDAGVWCVG